MPVAQPATTPTIADALGGVVRALEQLTAAVSSLATSQATAGAGALGGGPGGAGAGTSCGCGGSADAVAGAAGPGQLPPITQSSIAGAKGAPDAKDKADSKDKSDKKDKAEKAEKADKADAPAKASSKGEQIVAEAKKHIGKPYVYGAAGPGSFDCSGLTSYVLKQLGIKIPRTASQQMNSSAGKKITSKADLQPGDLVFFRNGGHTGIYIGDGKYVHAPKPGDKVKVASLDDSWAKSTYNFGRRFS